MDIDTFIQDTIEKLEAYEKRILELEKEKDEMKIFINSIKAKNFDSLDSGKINGNLELQPTKMIGLGKSKSLSYTANEGSSSETTRHYLSSTGEDPIGTVSDVTTEDSTLIFEHQPTTTGTTNQSFLFGFRPPSAQTGGSNTVTVTSGASTLTDATKTWTTNELAGAIVEVYDSSLAFKFARQIASNTSTIITIDGTWSATVTGGYYVVYMPIYLGSADYPWRQGYFGGQDVSSGGTGIQRRVLRFGYGTTTGADVIGVYFGTGSPEGVVTANIGSIFLRTDGSTSTTLYVKTANTDSSGWTAK